MKVLLVAALALSAGLLVVPAVNAEPFSSVDQAFVTLAAQTGLADVRLARLAMHTSSSPQIVRFAMSTQSVTSGLNVQLMSIAGAQRMMLPITLPARFEADRAHLQAESGAHFDHSYLALEVGAGQHTATAFAREVTHGENAALRNFARATLPTIQRRLRLARHDIAALDAKYSADATAAAAHR